MDALLAVLMGGNYEEHFAETCRISNPLLEHWLKWHDPRLQDPNISKFDKYYSDFMERRSLVQEYAWSVPTHRALTTVANYSNERVIDLFSGSGYWSKMIQSYGVDVIAVDNGKERRKEAPFPFFNQTVCQDVTNYLQQNNGCADRAVFVSWPRSMEWIEYYKGQTIIWIGERCGGTSKVPTELF